MRAAAYAAQHGSTHKTNFFSFHICCRGVYRGGAVFARTLCARIFLFLAIYTQHQLSSKERERKINNITQG